MPPASSSTNTWYRTRQACCAAWRTGWGCHRTIWFPATPMTAPSSALPACGRHGSPSTPGRCGGGSITRRTCPNCCSFRTTDRFPQASNRRVRRIAPVIEHGLQDGQGRRERVPIAYPSAESLAVHRHDHLRVTWCGDVPLVARVLIEIHHGRGIFKTDEFGDLAGLSHRVRDQLLVSRYKNIGLEHFHVIQPAFHRDDIGSRQLRQRFASHGKHG